MRWPICCRTRLLPHSSMYGSACGPAARIRCQSSAGRKWCPDSCTRPGTIATACCWRRSRRNWWLTRCSAACWIRRSVRPLPPVSGNSNRASRRASTDLMELTVGSTTYRLVSAPYGDRFVAHAERTDNNERFGIEATGATAEEAENRLERWLEWQHEHMQALEALQQAER